MSCEMDDSQLKIHCDSAVKDLSLLLESYKCDDCKRKKSIVMGYWIKTYVRFLKKEENFRPERLLKYKRGSIIKVDFGYRVGKEIGGLHYAVVIDFENGLYTHTITVIPLMSIKPDSRPSPHKIKLPDGLYAAAKNKLDVQFKKAFSTINQISASSSKEDRFEKSKEFSRLISRIEKITIEMESLKEGSYAAIGQITTISKIRVKSPIIKSDFLNGVKLSQEDMEIINNAIKGLYIF